MVAPDQSLSVESHQAPLKIPSLTDPSLIFLNVTPIKNIQPAFLPPLNLKNPSKDEMDQRSKEPKDLKEPFLSPLKITFLIRLVHFDPF